MPVLARIYTPQDFGVLSLYSSCMGPLSIVVTMSLEWAIQLPREDKEAFEILCGGALLVTIVSGLVGLAVILFGQRFAAIVGGGSDFNEGLWLLPASLVFLGFSQVFTYWGLRKSLFVNVTVSRAIQALGTVTSQVTFGLLRIGSIGLLTGDALGRFVGAVYWGHRLMPVLRPYLSATKILRIFRVLSEHVFFSLTVTPAALLNNLPASLTIILMTSFFGTQTGGLFSLGLLVVNVPVTVCHQVVGNVFVSRFSNLVAQSPSQARRFLIRTVLWLSALSMPVLLISFWGPPLFAIAFGEVWREAGIYAQILTIYSLGAIIDGTLYPVLTLLDKTTWQLAWASGRCFTVILFMFLIHKWGVGSQTIAMAYSITMCIFSVMHLCLSFVSLRSIPESI